MAHKPISLHIVVKKDLKVDYFKEIFQRSFAEIKIKQIKYTFMLKELNAQNQAYVVKNYFNNLDLSTRVFLDCSLNDYNFYYRMCDLDYYSYNTLLLKCLQLDCRLQNDSIYDSLWAFPNVR